MYDPAGKTPKASARRCNILTDMCTRVCERASIAWFAKKSTANRKGVSTVGIVYGRGSTRGDPARLICSLRMDVQFESRDRCAWT
jgi:hypothetical protein